MEGIGRRTIRRRKNNERRPKDWEQQENESSCIYEKVRETMGMIWGDNTGKRKGKNV